MLVRNRHYRIPRNRPSIHGKPAALYGLQSLHDLGRTAPAVGTIDIHLVTGAVREDVERACR